MNGDGRYQVTWDRWQEVDDLFDQVLDVPDHKRESFLAAACEDDGALYEAVLQLLGLAEQKGQALQGPDQPFVRAALSNPEDDARWTLQAGQQLGPYRLVSELGRGGMATVYEAERVDGVFSRRVALKVLRGGELDTDELVRRAIAERQILSGLQHPNIATLLDGGTTPDGRPFFVMELVEGEPLTTWVEGRRLSVHERVHLFLQVVDAVGYAHSQLVVHRDLKPSNVLVTPDGQVKLLDFGVAKLLGETGQSEDPLTRLGAAPMTPELASPEQLRGERVTAVSDVFQLGVLLYRLLTGTRPFDGETMRGRLMGAEVTLIRPSECVSDRTLARSLRGDLDTIVFKAMESAPKDRYGSAEALAADLRSQLEGRPINARPASPWVRLRKFSRRNPWFWPVAASAAIGLGGYVGTVVRYSHRVEQERNVAVAEAERAEALRGFMVSQFGLANPYGDGPANPEVSVVEAMALGAETARRELADQPLLEAGMLSAIAQVYGNLSLSEEALALLDEAMAIRTRHGAGGTAEQMEDLGLLGPTLGLTGQRDSARVVLAKSVDLEREMFGGGHPRTASALDRLSWHLYEDGEYQQALVWAEEAVQIRRAVVPPDRAALSNSLASLADSYRTADRWEDARRAALEAYELSRAEFGEEHPTTAGNKGHLAQVAHGMGDLEEAERLYREALPVLERTLGEQHRNTLTNWNNLGIVLSESDDLEGAEHVHRRILAIRLERYGTDQHQEVARSIQNLAALLVRQGRLVEADSMAQRSEQIFSSVMGEEHYSVAFALLTQSQTTLGRGLGLQAEQKLRRAIEILEPQFGPGYPTAAARCRLGRALVLQGRAAEAEVTITAALALLEGAAGVPEHEIRACAEALAAI